VHHAIKEFFNRERRPSLMDVIAFLSFILIVLPILAVRAGADTWQSNRHNWSY
jgi:hypothetical protein